jgi:hypothetical protein
MQYFRLSPDVFLNIGKNCIPPGACHPSQRLKLHVLLADRMIGCVTQLLGTLIGTHELVDKLKGLDASGVEMVPIEVGSVEEFSDRVSSDYKLPELTWLKISGVPQVDDFGYTDGLQVVVSDRVFELITSLGYSGRSEVLK